MTTSEYNNKKMTDASYYIATGGDPMILDIDKLKLAQARTGQTLAELGISRNQVYRINKGKQIRPTTLHKLAAALSCDPADLIKTGGDEA